jgi:DNA-binding transcriptional regulator YbjK
VSVRRQARGEERRKVILRATLALIEASGVDAVTHRAVSGVCDVPLGSVTYYFPTRSGLLCEALELWVEEEVERLSGLAAAMESERLSTAEVGARWAELLRGNDPHQVPQFELYLQASRIPELRAAAAAAFAAYERVAVAALTAVGMDAGAAERAAPVFVALADGMGLRRLAASGDDWPGQDEALVRLFEAFRAG